MYNYLTEKIENSKGFHVSRLTLIAFEGLSDGYSDVINDFIDRDTKEICEVLGFKTDNETLELIKNQIGDEMFIHLLSKNHRSGFLAEVHIHIPSNISTNKDGGSSWASSAGYCRVKWVYAHTVGELTDKAIKLADELFEEVKVKELTT